MFKGERPSEAGPLMTEEDDVMSDHVVSGVQEEVSLAPVSYILFIHSMYCMISLNSEPL